MINNLSNALPLPDSLGNRAETDDEAIGATTPGSVEPVSWVEVAANLSPLAAVVIKGRLESMEIPALVRQESIGSIMGLTVGPLGSASVLVPEVLAEIASDILSDPGAPDYGDENEQDVNDVAAASD